MQFSEFFQTSLTDNGHFHLEREGRDSYGFSCHGRKSDKSIRVLSRRSWRSDHEADEVLRNVSTELTKKLTDKEFIDQNIYLFNGGEYDHNTLDNFLDYSPGAEGGIHGSYIRTGNLVGYVNKKIHGKNHSVVVSSRFGDNFLKHIIASTDGFLEVPDQGDFKVSGLAEWLLVFLWKIKLKHAHRLGLPKEYVTRKEKISSFKGNISMQAAVTNPSFIPPYECSYREHSYNNSINQLIASTFRLIRNKSLILDSFKLKQDFDGATGGKRVPVTNLLACPPLKNPYFSDYNAVADLSKKIIRREVADFGESRDDLSAFFFDVSMLFEFFIRKVLIRKGFVLQEKNAQTYSVPSGGTYNHGFRRLYPDIVIHHSDGSMNIFDVKYKRFDFTYGVKREDIFQMNTYVANALSKGEVRRCGFIFPVEEHRLGKGQANPISQVLEIAEKRIPFEIWFFVIPPDADEDYSKKFNTSISKFFEERTL